ncbi:protein PTCD3 homolog, mitochondrial [Thrips palmi]|uniref:Small ribosomal subunit protein mS39 n=1 Tax=Thrips palmi TaxID=161013 RepID=A0A6P8ZIN2_THRPL|nr:protein PTCD3 homolog, mitochondrial [Thrips palmi]
MNSITCASKTYRSSNLQYFQLWWSKYSSTAAPSKETIKIPNRKHRGPTDILKALETTVSYDFTGPAYKFFDDPFLAPYNDRQARMYSLAKSAGQKAGTWVRDQHPELFTQVISDPPVMSYMPSPPINGDNANEEMLLQKIHDSKVSDAIKVYELMQEKKMDIRQETQLALLELLCFYNCEDDTPMENSAERYYGHTSRQGDPTINHWKNHPLVDSLFSSLKSLGSAPYCALICGLYMYGAKVEGDKLVEEAKEKKIKLDINAYNFIIKRTISIYDKVDVKWQLVQNILKEINAAGLKPNLGTLCYSIDAVSRMGMPQRYQILLQLVAEFKKAGVTPSIGVYGMIARGLVGRTRPDANLAVFLPSILESLKGKELVAEHPSDLLFFDWILKCCAVMEDLPSAINGLELFLHSRNRELLDGYRSTSFFNNFFHVLSKKADFPTLIKYYNLLVPHAHTPSPLFYQVLFDACDVHAEIKSFPTYWNHYMSSGSFNEETLLKMLEVAVNLTGLPDPEAIEMRKVVSESAVNLFLFKMEKEKDNVFVSIPLTHEMCDYLLHLFARGCQWRTIQTCLKFMHEKDFIPDEKAVSEILDSCYDHANPNMAVWVLKFCNKSFSGMESFGRKLELREVASKIMKADFLNDDLKKELQSEFEDSSSSSDSSTSDSESSDSDDFSDSEQDISVPRKPKPDVVKPDIKKIVEK